MSSQRQIDSARRNGALSRGPKTQDGKEKSSLNSTKHGLSSKKLFVLANESEEAFSLVLEAITAHFRPQTQMELDICIEMAHARWRQRRLWVVETAMIDSEMDRQHRERTKKRASLDEGTRVANAFQSLAIGNGALGLLTRYESRLNRNFHKLIERLKDLQHARIANSGAGTPDGGAEEIKKLQNEPDFVDRNYDPSARLNDILLS